MFEDAQYDLLDTAPCGFFIFSDDGIIQTVNTTLAQLLECRKEDLCGRAIESMLTLANRIFYQTHLFPMIKLHGKAEEIFLTLSSPSKNEVHVLLNARRITKNDTTTNHCIVVPVQQRRKYENELLLSKKAAEEALMKNEILLETQRTLEQNKQEMDRQVSKLTQMNRELTQFSKVISHDIQEPIRKIAIFADLALSEAEKQSNYTFKNALEKIKAACLRMRRLVTSLEQFLSLESVEHKTAKFNLNEVLEKGRMMAVQSSGYTGHLHVNAEPLPEIAGSRKQIELLFFHLIENSIKFRREDKVDIVIQSTIFQENSYKSTAGSYHYRDVVKITFTDNGKGFDTQHSNNLFKLFQKIQSDSYGTGLGLAVCKKIVDNHFGEISFDSIPGEGTTFYIQLPLMN